LDKHNASLNFAIGLFPRDNSAQPELDMNDNPYVDIKLYKYIGEKIYDDQDTWFRNCTMPELVRIN
jgi:hypothetical protein